MQFGKVQGIGMVALGVLLLLLQVYQLTYSAQVPASQTQAPPMAPITERKISYVPAVVGVGLLAFGGYLLLSQRRKNEEIQPRKTSAGFPM